MRADEIAMDAARVLFENELHAWSGARSKEAVGTAGVKGRHDLVISTLSMSQTVSLHMMDGS